MAETRVVITAEANQAIQEFERLRAEATNSMQQIDSAGNHLNRTTMSANQTANALSMIPAQFTDIIVSLQSGQAPITVLLQQGGQLRDMFGSISGAARALGGYVLGLINPLTLTLAAVGTLAYAYHEGTKEADAYAKSIILSGNSAGTSTGRLTDMARAIKQVIGTEAEAAGVLAALVATGQVGAENLQRFATVALRTQKNLGIGAEEMAKSFAELGESPLAASEKLSSQYHYLTSATYEQIKALVSLGKIEEAAAVAQNAFADSFDGKSRAMEVRLGYIERGWLAVKGAILGVGSAFASIGREKTAVAESDEVSSRIEQQQQRLQRLQQLGGGKNNKIDIANVQAELAALRTRQELLQAGAREELRSNEIQAAGLKQREAKNAWSKEGEKYLTREQQLRRAIEQVRTQGKDADIPETAPAGKDSIEARIRRVKQGFTDLNNVSMAGLEAQRALEREVLTGSLANLESSHRQGLTSDEAYIAEKRALALKDLDGEAAIIRKQADLAGGKADLSERTKYLGSLKALEQRRMNIIQESQNSLEELAAGGAKAVKDQSLTWANATIAEQQQLTDEISLFGKSAQARSISTAQIRVDTDARQVIADRIKQKHPLNEQEIADLQREAAARKMSIASILGEQQARAGAEQLQQENEKFAIESIFDDRERAAAQLQRDRKLWEERIRLAGEGTEAQKLLQEKFNVWYQDQGNKPMLGIWKESVTKYGDIFRTGFADMLNNGKSGWASFTKSLTTTFKTGVADQIYKMLGQPIIVKLVGSFLGVAGGGIAGAAQAASGAGGALSAAGSASSLYNTATGGMAGLTGMAGSGIAAVGNALGMSSLSAFGAGFGGAGAGAGMMTAAETFAGAGMAAEATAASLGSAFAAAVPWVGAALAAVAVWNKFFESGPEEHTRLQFASNNAVGNINNNERGESWAAPYIGNGSKSSLGTFGVRQTFWGDANGEVVQSFIKTVGQTDDALAAFMTTTEKASVSSYLTGKTYTANTGAEGSNPNATGELDKVFADRINNILTGVEPGLASLVSGFTGTSQALATEAAALLSYRAALKDSGEAVFGIRVTMQEIAALKLPTETTSAALARVTSEFTATSQVAQMLGVDVARAFGANGLASEAARAQLILLSGGLQTFSSQSAAFAQTYLTDEERSRALVKQVGEQMAALGYASITTKDQFKELVLGLVTSGAVATEAGAKQYAALMNVSAGFATAADAAAAAVAKAQESAKVTADLNGQIYDLTHSETEALARQRQLELAAMTATDAELQRRIYALTDEQAAAKSAADAAATAIAKAQADAAASQKVFSDFGNAIAGNMKAARDAAAAFRTLNDSLLVGSSSALSPEAKYLEAKRQFETADGTKLQAAGQALLDASKQWFGGAAGYAADFAAVISRNNQMAGQKEAEAISIGDFWQRILSSGVMGAHANGGVASGWSLVGEQGPEIINFDQPARVYTASQSREMIGGGGGGESPAARESAALLRELLQEARTDKVQRAAVSMAQSEEMQQLRAELVSLKRKVANA